MHPPEADIDGLYGKSKEAGRGLLQTETTYKAEKINKQDRQCTYNITLRHVSATTVAVESRKYYIF